MDIVQHRPKAVELALVQAGYSLTDIRGSREVHVYREPPVGWRAFLGRVQPRMTLGLAMCMLGLGGVLAYETTMLTPLLVSIGVAAALYAAGRVNPDSAHVEREVSRPGMMHREVYERLVQWNEWQRIEKEQEEREARKARHQAKGGV
jgi:hypothetical protein